MKIEQVTVKDLSRFYSGELLLFRNLLPHFSSLNSAIPITLFLLLGDGRRYKTLDYKGRTCGYTGKCGRTKLVVKDVG